MGNLYLPLPSAQAPWQTIEGVQDTAKRLKSALKSDLQSCPNIIKELLDDPYQTDTLVTYKALPNNAKLYVLGDLHGDFGPINALMNYLEKKGYYNKTSFALAPAIYVALLGDYIDRGPDSLKNLWYLSKLKEANQQQVLLIRGNHETEIVMENEFKNTLHSLSNKITTATVLFARFLKAFTLLPAITLLTTQNNGGKKIALLHGGFDAQNESLIGPNPKNNLTPKLFSLDAKHVLWNDMHNDGISQCVPNFGRGLGLIIDKIRMLEWMNNNNIAIVLRGHQQTDETYTKSTGERFRLFSQGPIPGIATRWKRVLTLNVAPNTRKYGRYNGFFNDFGVILRINSGSDNSNEKNEFSEKLQELNGYLATPIYFMPQEPNTIVDASSVKAHLAALAKAKAAKKKADAESESIIMAGYMVQKGPHDDFYESNETMVNLQ